MTRQKGTGNDRRVIMLRLRVTMAEKAVLQQRATEAGLSLSDWIRLKAIGTRPLTRKSSPERETLLRILAALGKSGSNLNQVARQLNRKQDNFEHEIPVREIMALLEEFKQISKYLRQTFYGDHKR